LRYSLLAPAANLAAEAAAWRPAFSHLALLVQIPGVDVAARVKAEKGSALTKRERAILDERTVAVRRWLEAYAPDRARLAVRRDGLPAEATALDAEQRRFLGDLARAAADPAWRPRTGEAWQEIIFRVAQVNELPSGRAFTAIYLAFVGRTSGPRAGWLLSSLEPEFVEARLVEAAAVGVGGAG
jgi:lysyl-tRNA synthetase class 1